MNPAHRDSCPLAEPAPGAAQFRRPPQRCLERLGAPSVEVRLRSDRVFRKAPSPHMTEFREGNRRSAPSIA